MEIQAKIDYIQYPLIIFKVSECEGIEEYLDKDIILKITQKRERRSLDSNAYFHVLADKLRQKLRCSMAYIKNQLIADYGQIEYVDEMPLIYKTTAPEEYMMEQEYIHSKCVKVAEENGLKVYFYRLYRGSHTYNTKEMAQLIEGTIQECKAQGIETATPQELAHMMQLWEEHYGKKQSTKGI